MKLSLFQNCMNLDVHSTSRNDALDLMETPTEGHWFQKLTRCLLEPFQNISTRSETVLVVEDLVVILLEEQENEVLEEEEYPAVAIVTPPSSPRPRKSSIPFEVSPLPRKDSCNWIDYGSGDLILPDFQSPRSVQDINEADLINFLFCPTSSPTMHQSLVDADAILSFFHAPIE